MPSATFYRLPDEKRDKIMEAIKGELAEHPISSVSINKIVQNAGISRGSFYQYFDDKYDMLSYVLEGYRDDAFVYFTNVFEKHNGDLFTSIEEILGMVLRFAIEQRNNKFYHNLFADMEGHKLLCGRSNKKSNAKLASEMIMDKISRENLLVNDEEELMILLEMIMDTSAHTVMELLLNRDKRESDEAIEKRFFKKMRVLEKGFTK